MVRKALRLQQGKGSGKNSIKFLIQEDGKVCVVRSGSHRQQERDSALEPFLDLLSQDMKNHPERIKPVPIELIAKTKELIGEVEVDLDAPLAGED